MNDLWQEEPTTGINSRYLSITFIFVVVITFNNDSTRKRATSSTIHNKVFLIWLFPSSFIWRMIGDHAFLIFHMKALSRLTVIMIIYTQGFLRKQLFFQVLVISYCRSVQLQTMGVLCDLFPNCFEICYRKHFNTEIRTKKLEKLKRSRGLRDWGITWRNHDNKWYKMRGYYLLVTSLSRGSSQPHEQTGRD